MTGASNYLSLTRRTFCTGALASFPAGLAASGLGSLGVQQEFFVSEVRRLAAISHGGIRMLVPSGCEENLLPVIRSFEDRTGVDVRLLPTPVDAINTRIALDWLNKKSDYDIVLPATFGVPDLASAGALRPIDDFKDRYETPEVRDSMLFQTGDSFDDRTYGFQADGDAYVMFYNDTMLSDPDEKSAFEDTFGAALRVPLTWAELDRQIEWFFRPDENIWGGVLFRTTVYVGWEWWVRFHAKGLWPLDPNLSPLIAGDAGVEALEEMIRVTSFLKNGVSHFGLFENWEQFAKGNVYCNIGWGGSQKFFNGASSQVREKLRFGPTPGGMVNDKLLVTPYFNWGWTMAVSAASEQPELAYLFALYASLPEISTLAVRQSGGFFDPHRVEHYRDQAIREIYSDEFLKVHRASMRDAIPDLYLANQSQYLGALNKWIERALDGEISAQEAMKRVAQSWELTTLRSDPERQKIRWRDLRRKYPADVRKRLSSKIS